MLCFYSLNFILSSFLSLILCCIFLYVVAFLSYGLSLYISSYPCVCVARANIFLFVSSTHSTQFDSILFSVRYIGLCLCATIAKYVGVIILYIGIKAQGEQRKDQGTKHFNYRYKQSARNGRREWEQERHFTSRVSRRERQQQQQQPRRWWKCVTGRI